MPKRLAMSVFDLLFLLAALASAVALVAATFFAVRGPRRRALNILRVYGICVLAYLTVGVATAFLRPQRVMATRDPWCLTVEQVSQTTSQQDIRYRVELRIFSRARRAAQRASGAWIYLIDDQGRRYSPDPDPSAVPLDILLQPHESVTTSRTFHVCPDVHGLGLITGHGGPYCGP